MDWISNVCCYASVIHLHFSVKLSYNNLFANSFECLFRRLDATDYYYNIKHAY